MLRVVPGSQFLALAIGIASALLVASVAHAQAREASDSALKVSAATGPALPLGKAAERWAALLGEGEPPIVAKLHPGAVLAGRDPARELLALRQGSADLAVGSALVWSMQVPALGVFSLPWIAPQDSDLAALARDVALRDALASRLEAIGVVLVAIAPLGHREIATLSKPVRSPDDVRGLRLRAMPAPLLHDLLLALGALPQAMSFREAQAAFREGALDGQEGPLTALAAARAGASGQRHLTDWGAVADAMILAVRKAVWETLDEAQRERVRRTAEQAVADTDAPAREAAAMRQLAANGVAIVRITPAGHAAFRAAVAGVEARWRDAIGPDVVSLAERAVASAAARAPAR